MRKERLHALTLVVGSLLALAIAFSHIFPEAACGSTKADTEQTEGAQKETYISLPTFSLPAPFHVQADPDAYCLFEILFEEEDDLPDVEQDMFFVDRFFETIFSVIISPNAP